MDMILSPSSTYFYGFALVAYGRKSFNAIWQIGQRGPDILRKWHTVDFDDIDDIARSKEHSMGVNGFEELLEEFPPSFDCVKTLCREIREILFPYRDGLLVGTPPGPPEKLYESIIDY